MQAKLVVAKGKTPIKEIPLIGTTTSIGRKAGCTLCIPSPLVSRRHCELISDGIRLVVKDLGSSNGTYVNGAKVKQKELQSGDTLGVGPLMFIVQLGKAGAKPGDTAKPFAPAAIADVADDGEAADFVVEPEDAEEGADFVVSDDTTAATDRAADFVVSDEAEPAEETEEASDFVVGEPAGEEALDLIVAEAAVPAEAEADFVVADEAAEAVEADVAEEADFVVAEEASTVHDVNLAELAGAVPAVSDASADEPAKKKGMFGRLFGGGKKESKPTESKPAAAAPASAAPKPVAVAPAKKPVAAAAPVAAQSTHEEPADFVTADEHAPAAQTAKVGDEDLADFLMGLNEKDQ